MATHKQVKAIVDAVINQYKESDDWKEEAVNISMVRCDDIVIGWDMEGDKRYIVSVCNASNTCNNLSRRIGSALVLYTDIQADEIDVWMDW